MMHTPYINVLFCSILCTSACQESSDKTPASSQEPAAITQSTQTPAAQGDNSVSVSVILKEYESMRAVLVKDSVEGIANHAQRVADAAGKAAAADARQRPHLEKIATAAKALKDKASGDIAVTRTAFGELSRQLVALLSADPALQKGLHIFECPMAEGYKKWIQPNTKIENPYMGQKMLECGGESTWS